MEPYNYAAQLQPNAQFGTGLQGIQAGLSLSQAIDQSRAQTLNLQQQQQLQSDLAGLAQKENPTAQDFAQVTIKHPQLAEHFKNTWSMLAPEQQASRTSHATQVYAALNAGRPDIAQGLVQRQADALKNAGNARESQAMATFAKLIEMSPSTARTSAGLMLSSTMSPDKFASTFAELEKLPGQVAIDNATATQKGYEAQMTPQRLALERDLKAGQLRDLDSQIENRAKRLGLDQDKLQTETQMQLYKLRQEKDPSITLSDSSKKLINDSALASTAAEQLAGQMDVLANKLDSTDVWSGARGRGHEAWKALAGSQDEVTLLRKNYLRVRNAEVLKYLPPGPATDKDVEIIQAGFPTETSPPEVISSFLRTMAKVSRYEAVMENAKSEWVNAAGYLGKPRRDITVDGVTVPAGTTFPKFLRTYVDQKSQALEQVQARSNLGTRSYMRWANQ